MQTEIVAIIMYEGKVKSGGYAKYNIAQLLNNNLDGTSNNMKANRLLFRWHNALILMRTYKSHLALNLWMK